MLYLRYYSFAFSSLLLAAFAVAQTEERRGWVSPPQERGTINIVFACLSTLFSCLYAVFHDDLPTTSNPSKLTRFLRKAQWLLVGIFAPEFIVILAGLQFSAARKSIQDMKKVGIVNWTLCHGFFANMHGFVLVQAGSNRKVAVDGRQLLEICKAKSPAEWWPKISREAIQDKSKADFLAKLLAFVQATWLIAQIVGRAVASLSISPLEIESAAYVPLTLVVYLLWWHKPLNVEVPIEVPISVDLYEVLGITESDAVTQSDWRSIVLHISGGVRTFASIGSALSVMTLGMLFGAVHVLAWEFSFPTTIESQLWRAASIFTVLGGFFAHSIISMINRTLHGKSLPHRGDGAAAIAIRIWDLAGWPMFLVYFFSRCYLIFESFYSLRSLPADTFHMVSWSRFIPHI
ncbi:hypothetical protein DL96DRAFT_1605741 [Flagelloscypha sp. PMI_526]|nr:hypothetical protein DL96DRAFT_1605741 [Flagelloscypha sp. PMI_526]